MKAKYIFMAVAVLCIGVLSSCKKDEPDAYSPSHPSDNGYGGNDNPTSSNNPMTPFSIPVVVMDPAGKNVIEEKIFSPSDVYVLYKGKRHVCFTNEQLGELTPPTDQLLRLFGDHLEFGPFEYGQEYDGETFSLRWRDGSVDEVKFTLWSVYDEFTGTLSWVKRLYLNGKQVGSTIKLYKDLWREPSLDDEIGAGDCLEPVIWFLDGEWLSDYNIQVGPEGADLHLETVNYPQVDTEGTSAEGCSWITLSVEGPCVDIAVDPFDSAGVEIRSAQITLSVRGCQETITITQQSY